MDLDSTTTLPLVLTSHSAEDTQDVGRSLGQMARPGEIYLLTGVLGAGKTWLTQGIAWGLGVPGYARSPTFVMVARYMGRLILHHIDLFRVQDTQEAWDLGLEEYLYDGGVCVIEWADQAAELFPPDSIWINLEYGAGEEDRVITLQASPETNGRLLEALKHRTPQDKAAQ